MSSKVRPGLLTFALPSPEVQKSDQVLHYLKSVSDDYTIVASKDVTSFEMYFSIDAIALTAIMAWAEHAMCCIDRLSFKEIDRAVYPYPIHDGYDYDKYISLTQLSPDHVRNMFQEKSRLIMIGDDRARIHQFLINNLVPYAQIAMGYSGVTSESINMESVLGCLHRTDETLLLEVCQTLMSLDDINISDLNDVSIEDALIPRQTPLYDIVAGIPELGTSSMRPKVSDPYLPVLDINDVALILISKDRTITRNQAYIRRILHEYFSQDRVGSGNCWVHVASLSMNYLALISVGTDPEVLAAARIPLAYIFAILNWYNYKVDGLPFYVGRRSTYVRKEVPISSNINIFINALCYIYTGVVSGMIHPRMCHNIILIYSYYASHRGIMTSMMKFKSLWKSLFVDIFNSGLSIKHNRWTQTLEPHETTTTLTLPAITLEEMLPKRSELDEFANAISPRILIDFQAILRTCTTVNHITQLQSTVGYMSYLAIFIKGTIDVAGSKNLDIPKYAGMCSITNYYAINGAAYAMRFDDFTESLITELCDYISPKLGDVDVPNIEEEVFQMQTTSRAYDSARLEVIKQKEDGRLVKIHEQRIIDFLTSLPELSPASASRGCVINQGTREQIGREKRAITAIPTSASISQSVFYAMFMRAIPMVDEMAATKTTGNLGDVSDLIHATSSGGIIISLDVSGADITTTSVLVDLDQEILRRLLHLPAFKSSDIKKVFGFEAGDRYVTYNKADGTWIRSSTERLTVVDQLVAHYKVAMQAGHLKSDDTLLEKDTSFLLDRFSSGVLTTSLMHTLRFIMFLRHVDNEVKSKFPGIKTVKRVLGDDVKYIIMSVSIYNRDDVTTYAVQALDRMFKYFGYTTTGAASFTTGEFLMKYVTLGQEVSPLYRCALFTEEKRSAALDTAFMSRFDSTIAIFHEAMPRSREPFILYGILRGILAQLSWFNLGSRVTKDKLLQNNIPNAISPVYYFIGRHGFAFIPTYIWSTPGIDKTSPTWLNLTVGDRKVNTGVLNPLVIRSPAYHRVWLYLLQRDKVDAYSGASIEIAGLAQVYNIRRSDYAHRIDFDRVKYLNWDIYSLLNRVDPLARLAEQRSQELFASEMSIPYRRSANSFLSPNGITDSIVATNALRKKGIKLHDSLIYALSADIRLKQAFTIKVRKERDEYPTLLANMLNVYHRSNYIPFDERNRKLMDSIVFVRDDRLFKQSACQAVHPTTAVTYPICQIAFCKWLEKLTLCVDYPLEGQSLTTMKMAYENWSRMGVDVDRIESIIDEIRKKPNSEQLYSLFLSAYRPSYKVRVALDSYMSRARRDGIVSSVVSLRSTLVYYLRYTGDNPNITRSGRKHGSVEREEMAKILAFDTFNLNLCCSFSVVY